MAITMRDMLAAGVHFGHRTRYWNPKMAPYIYGARNGIHIINLEKTLPLYQDALNFLTNVVANKGKVLFVGTKTSAQQSIRENAARCGMPFVDHRWLGGMLTNYKTVRQSIKQLKHLEELQASGAFEKMIKKEALQMKRKLTKLERALGGIKAMNGIPDAIFVLDVGHENIAITEARKLKIPVVGIVDTNHSPDNIDYVIPGNDDSMRAIDLYLTGIADAIVAIREATGVLPQDEIAEEIKVKPAKAKTIVKAKKVQVAPDAGEATDQTDTKAAKTAAKKPAAKVKVTATVKKAEAIEAKPVKKAATKAVATKSAATKTAASKTITAKPKKTVTKTSKAEVVEESAEPEPAAKKADDTKVEVK